ncbi:hypothetical protein AA14337_1564 [Acetobacter malorum DSM 14337]|uniref:Restriction endonuclease type IV Mrr domain-containing protein n=1 Tax=Acetobacter malorum DSM 14337 TaxID=1307910 RepID=A0ABQ0PSM5_9PROT|nr:hypothetical protein [Acetobacter malorum]KXV09418.1 hypothetical protein AD930_02655 [Acetobacter malorum]GBQ79880.1 hypothetical protein AA14337_1564 [Acetobacter malorum DSM 14337]
MFVTEKIGPLAIVSDLLAGESVAEDQTWHFERYRHNKDLCPGFRDRILRVLNTYEKHRIDVHDIQGFQDKGVDVIVRVQTDEGLVRLGLQIKSEKEIVDWKNGRSPHFIANIRNQYTQARQEAKVNQLYLVLCANAVAHRDHLRTLINSFVDYEGLKVILPESAFGFFSMSDAEIDVAVTRRLCSRDFLLLEARRSIDGLPPGCSGLALTLIFRALNGDSVMTHSEYEKYIFATADEVDCDDPAELMTALNRTLVENISIESYRIVPNAFPAICAVYFDQIARHNIGSEGAAERTSLLVLGGEEF